MLTYALFHSVHVLGERIYVADTSDSVSFLRYNTLTNQLEVVASDTRPRWVTGNRNRAVIEP